MTGKKYAILSTQVLVLVAILLIIPLRNHEVSAREGWSYELCEAADDLLQCDQMESAGEPRGIILLKSGWFDEAKRTKIYRLNSKAGKAEPLAEFACRPGQSLIVPTGVYGNRRDLFTSDWMKMAATAYVDGLAHAGWIDQDGNFTDVTAALGLESRRDESGYTDYSAVGFRDDQTFYFRERSIRGLTDELKFYATSIDGLELGPVVEVGLDDAYAYFWQNAYHGTQTWSQTVQDRMQPNTVVNERYILSDYGDPLTGAERNFVITTPEYAIPVFEDKTVSSWSPVLSPNRQSIAYLSCANTEERVTSFCTMSLKSGKIKVLETGNLLHDSSDEAGEKVVYTILDWH